MNNKDTNSKGGYRSLARPNLCDIRLTLVIPMDNTMKEVYDSVIARDPNQPEFHQAVEEVLDSLGPVIQAHPEYLPVVRSIVEAERIIQFRVPWWDDDGNLHVNRGFRIQNRLPCRLEIPTEIAPCLTRDQPRRIFLVASKRGACSFSLKLLGRVEPAERRCVVGMRKIIGTHSLHHLFLYSGLRSAISYQSCYSVERIQFTMICAASSPQSSCQKCPARSRVW